MKRVGAPVTRVNVDGQDIGVNPHVRGKVQDLSRQSNYLGPGGCGFDDTNDGIVKANCFELEKRLNIYSEKQKRGIQDEKKRDLSNQ